MRLFFLLDLSAIPDVLQQFTLPHHLTDKHSEFYVHTYISNLVYHALQEGLKTCFLHCHLHPARCYKFLKLL